MKVRATRMGYFNNQRKREGEVFIILPKSAVVNSKKVVITPEAQFSENWMEKVAKPAPAEVFAPDAPSETPGSPETPAPGQGGEGGTGDQGVI